MRKVFKTRVKKVGYLVSKMLEKYDKGRLFNKEGKRLTTMAEALDFAYSEAQIKAKTYMRLRTKIKKVRVKKTKEEKRAVKNLWKRKWRAKLRAKRIAQREREANEWVNRRFREAIAPYQTPMRNYIKKGRKNDTKVQSTQEAGRSNALL